MKGRLAIVFALGVLCAACGGSTPTTPSQPPVVAADLRLSGQGSWTSCILGDCIFSASIQNMGAGCASGTTVVARFYDASNAQVGRMFKWEDPLPACLRERFVHRKSWRSLRWDASART